MWSRWNLVLYSFGPIKQFTFHVICCYTHMFLSSECLRCESSLRKSVRSFLLKLQSRLLSVEDIWPYQLMLMLTQSFFSSETWCTENIYLRTRRRENLLLRNRRTQCAYSQISLSHAVLKFRHLFKPAHI